MSKPKATETPEEKRRREIMEIKKQLDEINKKMETNKTSNQNNKNESNLIKPKNSGVAQSMIFSGSSSNNSTNFQPNYNMNNFNVNKINPSTNNEGSSLSALDKLYEQKKNQQQQGSFKVEKVEKKTSMEQNINIPENNKPFTNIV